jgi:hypothetical protein
MVLSLLSGLPPKPRGKRWVRSAWRLRLLEKRHRHLLRNRRKRALSDFAKTLNQRDSSGLAKSVNKSDLSNFAKTFLSDRGSVESALVVIPLMTLFLISFQLVLAISSRNIEASYAQSAATHNSITGRFEQGDVVIDLNSPDAFNKLRAVVTTQNRALPNLVPHLGNQDHTVKVHGFSILENQGS